MEMKFAVIVHGKGGSPDTSWLPWIKSALEARGYVCLALTFPNEPNSKLADWFTVFDTLKVDYTQTIFIAHARGAMATLRWIERLPSESKIHQIITVSCNYDFIPDHQDGDELYTVPLDYEDLLHKCAKIVVIHSADDPFVPIEAGEQLARNLHAKFVRFEDAGHFGADKLEAPEILNQIVDY